ncbi:MAG: carbohydrate-binding family 9-like protein, partial [Armatimonadota bacterium]
MRALSRVLLLGCVILLCLPASILAQPPDDEVVLPRLESAPRIDGRLDEDAWEGAAVADRFTLPLTATAPEKATVVRLGFTDEGIFISAQMAEPDPAGLKTEAEDGASDVWKDDCLEVWLRATEDRADLDQFIVNAAGARQRLRSRTTGAQTPQPQFPAAASVGEGSWTVELLVAFEEIGLAGPPQPGDMIQLKLGREDPEGGTTVLSTWPPRSPYGQAEGYGRAYFITSNLLPNADFTETDDEGAPAGWGFGEDQLERTAVVEDQGRPALRWETPNRYAAIQRSIQLEPNAQYRLEARVRGDAGIYLRSRTKEHPDDEASRAFTVTTEPGEQYEYYGVSFPTGADGRALIILGNYEGLGAGTVYLTDLAVVRQASIEASGPAIVATPGETVRITDIGIADCRALRGFVGGPVDGRLDSVAWNGSTWEYGAPHAGAGVYYDFANGDGLHVTLTDDRGVDAVQIRGGAKVRLYRDATSYYQPGEGELVWDFRTNAASSRAIFGDRVMSDRFSFFELQDGFISDLYFFRLGEEGELPQPTILNVQQEVQPEDLAEFASRFGTDPGPFHLLSPTEMAARLQMEEDRWAHFVTPPMEEDRGLMAVGLRLQLSDAPAGLPLEVALMDPWNPRQRVINAQLAAEAPGTLHIVLDHLDQVIPEGRRVWVALRAGAQTTIETPRVELHFAPVEQARTEALEYRKWIVKTMFAALSEPRPWGSLRSRDQDLQEWAKDAYAGEKVVELLREAEFAKRLGPEDDIVRQYDEWLWRRAGISEFQPTIDRVPGAPEWAVVLRQAWLEARAVPQWWMENRLVPTGELGGRVGDDTDMYQNYAMFPMISDDPVARQVYDGAARLAEHAEATTMEEGLNSHTTDPLHAYEEGVNHEALMTWWGYGDPVYFERSLAAARSMPALTVVTDLGHRHFKNQSLGAEDLRIDRELGVDGHAHPLMLHPLFEVLWYNRHPQVEQFLREWADGWLEHQQPGAYATSVDVATEEATQVYENRPLYGGYGGQASAFAGMILYAGGAKYARPFLDAYENGWNRYTVARMIPEMWQAGLLDGLTQEQLGALEEAEPYLAVLRRGDRAPLIGALTDDIAEMQRFPHMYTTAEQFTDRIFLYAIENAAKAYCGAFATRNKYTHPHAVSWEGFGTDFAALVLDATADRLKVAVYSFADEPMEGAMRVWRLDHGRYRVTLGPDADGDDRADSVASEREMQLQRYAALPITLPPRQTTIVEVTQTEALAPIRERADLALSPLDTAVEEGVARGVVHNIGVAPVASAEIALLSPAGEVVQRETLTQIPGIGEDLQPVRLDYELTGVPADPAGWRVVIDHARTVEEIYEGNNVVRLTGAATGNPGHSASTAAPNDAGAREGQTMTVRAHYYEQFDADYSLDVPAEGFGGWKSAEVEIDPAHTAVVVMHAWDCGTYEEYPGWWKRVEYIPRANKIARTVFPPLLSAVRDSPMRLFHVVGGGDYYKDLPGYQHARQLAAPAPEAAEQIEADPTLQKLRQFKSELIAHIAQDTRRGFERVDFLPEARPLGEEGVAENAQQLFALCREAGVNHLLYAGFAINWCLLLSPGGMADMSKHGIMCSAIRDATTAVENRETA